MHLTTFAVRTNFGVPNDRNSGLGITSHEVTNNVPNKGHSTHKEHMKVLKFDATTGTVTLEIKLNMTGETSASGKSKVHFSTKGNQRLPEVTIGGKPLTIGINAYTPVN